MSTFIRAREIVTANYRAIYFNGKTVRFAIDPAKPITKLPYPEFYDVKITDKCEGGCPNCYQNSTEEGKHGVNLVEKILTLFGHMPLKNRPFQVAIGGGEPTDSPDFINVLKAFHGLSIVPNFTTNGINVCKNQLKYIKKYCGGVAVSCHPHLQDYWQNSASIYKSHGLKINFHFIISDEDSIKYFDSIYKNGYFRGIADYFVLLPYVSMGRANKKQVNFDYMFSVLDAYRFHFKDVSNIAFGAGFYERLKKESWPASLYEPESMSGYLDLVEDKEYNSSFDEIPIRCLNF